MLATAAPGLLRKPPPRSSSSFSPAPQRRAAKPTERTVRKRQAYAFGLQSERSVAAFLRTGDYKIIATRAKVGNVEVDLIAARDEEVAFVEVKGRRKLWDGLESVTTAKMCRLSRAADRWLAANDAYAGCSVRFDIALVGADGALEYLENAFEYHEPGDFVF